MFWPQEDGCGYSELDTLSMLRGAGLSNQRASDWLMALHGQLRECLSANQRPGLCDLLRSAVMVKQQREKGVGLNLALRHAADNVYVRNMKSLASRQVGVVGVWSFVHFLKLSLLKILFHFGHLLSLN